MKFIDFLFPIMWGLFIGMMLIFIITPLPEKYDKVKYEEVFYKCIDVVNNEQSCVDAARDLSRK